MTKSAFPLSRAMRKKELEAIQAGGSINSMKIPGEGMMKVYKIPLNYLSYNPYNTRFLAQAKTLERRFGTNLSDENPEHVKEIEKFIWEEKKISKLKNNNIVDKRWTNQSWSSNFRRYYTFWKSTI